MSDKPTSVDIAALRAQQEVQMQSFLRDVIEITSREEIGAWIAPPGLEQMMFFRCGVRYSDGSMPPGCARAYHRHKSMGALDAPKGMRPPVGFESDDNRGVYVMYFPENWAKVQAARNVAAQIRDPMREFQSALGGAVSLDIREATFKPKTRK